MREKYEKEGWEYTGDVMRGNYLREWRVREGRENMRGKEIMRGKGEYEKEIVHEREVV